MSLSIFLSFLTYEIITAITPGPNNFVSFYSVSQYGWKKGSKVILGIAVGFFIVMILCALLCYQLIQFIPTLAKYLKYLGAAYIAYLAITIVLSKPSQSESRPMTFLKGFLLEFMNVKIIMCALTIYSGYVLPVTDKLSALLLTGCTITAIGLSGCLLWAAAGKILQGFMKKHFQIVNICMALLLLWCAIKIIL